MPEVLGDPPSPRTALFWNGTEWQWALVDAAGHLQIDTVTSALPVGAATAANQIIINTTVGLVALIRNALQTVDTDRLIVRGDDQLFSIQQPLIVHTSAVISGVDGFIESTAPGAGEYWVVTTASANNQTSPTTEHFYLVHRGAQFAYFYREAWAILAWIPTTWGGHVYLGEGDTVRVNFIGGLAGDTCVVELTGYVMTLET